MSRNESKKLKSYIIINNFEKYIYFYTLDITNYDKYTVYNKMKRLFF